MTVKTKSENLLFLYELGDEVVEISKEEQQVHAEFHLVNTLLTVHIGEDGGVVEQMAFLQVALHVERDERRVEQCGHDVAAQD